MIKRTLLLLGIFVFVAATLPARAQTTTKKSPDRLILILDASGSMWGKIGGENKIAIARRVMKNLVTKLSDDTQIVQSNSWKL